MVGAPTAFWAEEVPVVRQVRCASCNGPVELACEGLHGTVMYATYNEYFCPHCRKQNHALTPGQILSVRPPQNP